MPPTALCAVCATPAALCCAGCKVTPYCGPEHQAADWADHKGGCKALAVSRAAVAASAALAAVGGANTPCGNPPCGAPCLTVLKCGCALVCYCSAACLEAHSDEHAEACVEAVRARLRAGGGELQGAAPLLEARLAAAHNDVGNVIRATTDLAASLQGQGRLREAEPHFREALARSQGFHGPEHPHTLTVLGNLAGLLVQLGRPAEALEQGKFDDAERLYRSALPNARAALGDDNRLTLSIIANLAAALQVQGKLAEAEPLLLEGLNAARRTLGSEHPDTLASITNYASLLMSRERLEEAEALYREAVAACCRVQPGSPDTMLTVFSLAVLLEKVGRKAEAEALYREALAGFRAALGNAHPHTRTCSAALAHVRA